MSNYKTELDQLPIYSGREAKIPAPRYNRVRLAMRRLGGPMRLELPGLRTLDLILEDQVWAVVDRSLNDIPVMAWTDFAHRSDLHTPVPCTMRYYHAHARMIEDRVLTLMDQLLDYRLHVK